LEINKVGRGKKMAPRGKTWKEKEPQKNKKPVLCYMRTYLNSDEKKKKKKKKKEGGAKQTPFLRGKAKKIRGWKGCLGRSRGCWKKREGRKKEKNPSTTRGVQLKSTEGRTRFKRKGKGRQKKKERGENGPRPQGNAQKIKRVCPNQWLRKWGRRQGVAK